MIGIFRNPWPNNWIEIATLFNRLEHGLLELGLLLMEDMSILLPRKFSVLSDLS
jgi:hypothetical protein